MVGARDIQFIIENKESFSGSDLRSCVLKGVYNMKRLKTLFSTVLIVALLASCSAKEEYTGPFTFKTESRDGVYHLFEPRKIKTLGVGAEMVDIYYAGRGATNAPFFETLSYLSVQSKDDSYYTVGLAFWENGMDVWDTSGELGYVERLEGDEWVAYYRLYDSQARNWYGATNIVRPAESAGGKDGNVCVNLPLWEPGTYRAVLTLRDYLPPDDGNDSDMGVSGVKTHAVYFEYEVPEWTDEPMEVLLAEPTYARRPTASEDGDTAYLNLTLRANTPARYIDYKNVVLERFDEAADDWVGTDYLSWFNEYAGIHILDRYAEQVMYEDSFSVSDPERYYASTEHSESEKYRLSVVSLLGIELGALEPEEEYRITIPFTENEDGTGEQYTIQLRMQFD